MTQPDQFLRQLPLFEKCAPEDIHRLALGLRWHSYKTGDTILFQGMISHQMFFIMSGRAGVFTRQGRETRRVADLAAGDYFGEISLLTNKAATATVKAEADDTQVYTLDRDDALAALSQHPGAMADITERIRQRNQNRHDAFHQDEEPAAAPA